MSATPTTADEPRLPREDDPVRAADGDDPGASAPRPPSRLVVLISGTGTNLAALLEACRAPQYGAQIVAALGDRPCTGLDRAQAAGVPTAVVAPRDFEDRAAWDRALADEVTRWEPDLVVCAGFMRILGPAVLDALPGRIINTHPSLLPDFPGAHAVRDALAAGATRTGATLFWVDAGVDTGEPIAQVAVPVLPQDDEDSLTARVKAAETPQLVEQVGRLSRGARRPRAPRHRE